MSLPSFSIQASKHLSVLLILLYMGGSACLIAAQMPLVFKLMAYLVVSYLFWRQLQRYALLRSSHSVCAVSVDAADNWWLKTRSGDVFNGRLLGNSFISHSLVVLNFRRDKKWCIVPVVLFPDAVDLMTFRRLKVYLLTK